MLFASLLLSTKTNPDDVHVCYTLIKKYLWFEINIGDGLDHWEAWFLIRTKVTSELIARSNFGANQKPRFVKAIHYINFKSNQFLIRQRRHHDLFLYLQASKGKRIPCRSYFMTGSMRHRDTYYEHLHAKITKYVDLRSGRSITIYCNVF